MFLKAAVLFIIVHIVIAKSYVESELGEVVFVNILFRHGDRTPVDPYPNDPYRNASFWPTGWGQLTDKGKRGHYQLGKWLRARYANLLPMDYTKEDIYVQSTDVDRTLMSAYSNLAGLYEPSLDRNWSPDIRWQPIPVHTTAELEDRVRSRPMWPLKVLAAKKPCPRYNFLMKTLVNSEDFKKRDKGLRPTYEYLSTNAGINVTDLGSLEYLYNTLFIENLYRFELPVWTEKVFPEPMKELAALSFTVPCYNRDLARLKSGPLVGSMLTHMLKKANDTLDPPRKAWIYSAHDTTVANLLQALGVFEPHSPPYLSTVMMELRKKDGLDFVTLFYRNSTAFDPYLLTLPGCQALCPLNTFQELVTPLIPSNWERECQLRSFSSDIYNSITGYSLVTSAGLATLFLLVLLLAMHVYRKQYYSRSNIVYHSLNMEAPKL